MDTPREIEVKLRGLSPEQLTHAGLRLELETPRHFEDNWLLDTPDGLLSSRAAILRVREVNGQGSLTYKERLASETVASQFKARLELETQLDQPQNAVAILERLGCRKWFRYQKFRTVYQAQLPSGARLDVMFDETPLGDFAELEGAEESLAEAVQLLGVVRADFILESYLALQMAYCHAQGRELEDMVF